MGLPGISVSALTLRNGRMRNGEMLLRLKNSGKRENLISVLNGGWQGTKAEKRIGLLQEVQVHQNIVAYRHYRKLRTAKGTGTVYNSSTTQILSFENYCSPSSSSGILPRIPLVAYSAIITRKFGDDWSPVSPTSHIIHS